MPLNFIHPNSISRLRLYALLMTGVVLGILTASVASSVDPSRFPYVALSVALIGAFTAMLIVWLVRLQLVGRVARNIEGRISQAISQLGVLLIIGMLGVLVVAFVLIVLLVLGIFLEWDLGWWGQTMISVVAVHMMLRAVLGIVVNVGLITHRHLLSTDI